MKREIKFRGKMVDSYDWWMYGYLREVWGEKQRNFVIAPAKKFQSDGYTDKEEDYVQVETIGQFTGHTDKNGKEIYEDDLLKTLNGTIVLVEWVEGGFKITNIKDTMSTACLSKRIIENLGLIVIGNIHDNPELLED